MTYNVVAFEQPLRFKDPHRFYLLPDGLSYATAEGIAHRMVQQHRNPLYGSMLPENGMVEVMGAMRRVRVLRDSELSELEAGIALVHAQLQR